MPQKAERRSAEGKPPTAILQAIKEMPWYQRFLVKTIGLVMLVGPAYVGMQMVPHLIHEDTSWVLALILLTFLAIVMLIGLAITAPKTIPLIGSVVPIPGKWRQLMDRPERRNG